MAVFERHFYLFN